MTESHPAWKILAVYLNWMLAVIYIHKSNCAVPIDVVTETVVGKVLPNRNIPLIIPDVQPLIDRRNVNDRDTLTRNKWYRDHNGWYRYNFVPGRFVNDDYQPLLRPKSNPYPVPSSAHGNLIFLNQIIPIMRSMITAQGIEQGPPNTYRVHRDDLWAWGDDRNDLII